jgi:hypothetical protein
MRQILTVQHLALAILALCVALGPIPQEALAQENSVSCTQATLNGVYVFSASGFNIVNSTPAPKAVVEVLTITGDGNLTSLATASIDGTIHSGVQDTGIYTVNPNCSGTLSFHRSGLTFDIYLSPNGSRFHMIQTNPNTVLQGEVRRISH